MFLRVKQNIHKKKVQNAKPGHKIQNKIQNPIFKGLSILAQCHMKAPNPEITPKLNAMPFILCKGVQCKCHQARQLNDS